MQIHTCVPLLFSSSKRGPLVPALRREHVALLRGRRRDRLQGERRASPWSDRSIRHHLLALRPFARGNQDAKPIARFSSRLSRDKPCSGVPLCAVSMGGNLSAWSSITQSP